LFAKGRGSKFKASELNLYKEPMGECLSYRSFCQNLIVKNSTFSLASTDVLNFVSWRKAYI